ncbi:PQQ-dependent sugar dehydrogenase [Erythrobacter sp. GH1-10]|uniref:PQQ-dependent sugar dehydrogenase n=1 Tax=Erythrobacter sp. GH1-10 TaxID=3349334 RepID=UPI0038781CA2
MKQKTNLSFALSLSALALASCAQAETGDSQDTAADTPVSFTTTAMGEFEEPWAIEFIPGTALLAVTEKEGTLKLMDIKTEAIWTVAGVPEVDYGGQGGFGDIAFLESEADADLSGRTVYLSWAEAGEGDTRGAAVGKATLMCPEIDACALEGLEVIWRQTPKVTGKGHYSHRITFSPDEQHMFVTSGDRQKQTPAQDRSNTMGTIVRLNLDGTPAAGNPFADEGGAAAEIWTYGNRNMLGIDWDTEGRLWEVEHGPAGGDELNLVQKGANYGWPTRSYGDNYNGDEIPDHTEDDGFTKPAIHWTPVIAPGDMIIYSGDMFAPWKGDALIAGLKTQAIIRVSLDGETATEAARYDFDNRLRSIEQGPDGSIYVAEDGPGGRVLRLTAE